MATSITITVLGNVQIKMSWNAKCMPTKDFNKLLLSNQLGVEPHLYTIIDKSVHDYGIYPPPYTVPICSDGQIAILNKQLFWLMLVLSWLEEFSFRLDIKRCSYILYEIMHNSDLSLIRKVDLDLHQITRSDNCS